MADNAAIADALNALTQAITAMNQNTTNTAQAAHAPPAPVNPQALLDPFASPDPFDLSTQAGSSAYLDACAPLPDLWDGSIAAFPSFIVALRIRSSKIC